MTYDFQQNPIGQRLKAQMQQCGVTSAQLAKRADVKTSFIYDVISGKSANPSPVKLARMANSLGVELSALLGIQSHSQPPKYAQDEQVAISRITLHFSSRDDKIILEEKTAESHYFKNAWIRERMDVMPEKLKMLYAQGDGMEPAICAGDLLMIDTSQREPSPAGIFVLFDGISVAVKRLEYAQGQRLRILCDNPHHAPYERSPEETYIIGRVVWLSREL